ncbi:PspC domain protein [Arthrobacter saudimassiliensis]|uniref:PspC domain protein n=1 Tax=Arthrobacter saudimassiliensis TaxID=1461584 RepID=A0A078MRM0_9MICC|nr:PspC domain protein [Arthrobacter saudimassiliensis]
MNESSVPGAAGTPDSPSPAGGRPAGSPGRPPAGAFFAWVRGLGVVRSGNRWIAGVAEGIAVRTGLDPALVRGLFIVFGLFGVGLLAYGVAWALLPEPDGRIQVEEAAAGRWSAGMTGALVFSVLGLGGPGISFWARDGWLSGAYWGVFWIAGVIVLVYWLSTRKRQPGGSGGNRPPGAFPADGDGGVDHHGRTGPDSAPAGHALPGLSSGTGVSAADGDPAVPDTASPAAGEASAAGRGAGPSAAEQDWSAAFGAGGYGADSAAGGGYGVYGADRRAGTGYGTDAYGDARNGHHDWETTYGRAGRGAGPDPDLQVSSSTPPGGWTMLLLGAALLTAGVLLALDYTGSVTLEAPAATALAAAAGVLGLGIVVLGCLGRSSGPSGALAVLALVGGAAAGGNLLHSNLVVANRSAWTVDSAGRAADGYTVAAAQGNLDLTGLADELRDGTVTVPVSVAAGDVAILVPDDVPVSVRSQMVLGNVSLEEGGSQQTSAGIWTGGEEKRLNADEEGSRLVIEVQGIVSNVLVTTNESGINR